MFSTPHPYPSSLTASTLDGNHAFVADKIMTYIQQKAIKIPSICVSQNVKMMIMFC